MPISPRKQITAGRSVSDVINVFGLLYPSLVTETPLCVTGESYSYSAKLQLEFEHGLQFDHGRSDPLGDMSHMSPIRFAKSQQVVPLQ